jgi:GPH family glycoside/pentoside/hexuronide:cation symporter
MIADVAEDVAVKTGVRSEGLLFAANGLLPKITGGLGAVAGTMMLEAVRFPAAAIGGAPALVDPAIMRHLALISLPAGAILNLVSLALLGFYRIDKSSHEANLEALRLAASVTATPTSLPIGGLATGGEPGSLVPPL